MPTAASRDFPGSAYGGSSAFMSDSRFLEIVPKGASLSPEIVDYLRWWPRTDEMCFDIYNKSLLRTD